MENLSKVLEEGILRVFNGDGTEINFKTKEIKLYKPKYSSTGKESITLFLDGVPMLNNKKNARKVEYKCTCGNISTICLSKYLNKTKMSCCKCREDEEKIKWHKLYFRMRREGKLRGNKEKEKTIYDFNSETEEFKNEYFKKKLTEKEFQKFIKYVYSIDDVEIEDKNIKFLPHEPSTNSKKYTQKVEINGIIHSLKNIKMRCPLCGDIFHITRMPKERINANNFDCKKCFLSNKTFAVKRYKENLTYQGNEELSFIQKCEYYGIDITNGDKVKYEFEGRPHIYTIDFKLKDYKLMIEIKDNHIWHKKQVESGKWEKKKAAAEKYCKSIGYKFLVLFTQDIENFFKTYERDSLTFIER